MPDFPIPYGLSGGAEAMRSFGAAEGPVESTGHAEAVPSVVDTLTAIGSALRGIWWESSTLTELLQQAIRLADHLLTRLQASHPAVVTA
jgi:hypothetical protein